MRSELNDSLQRWREEQRKRQLRESEARHREMLKTHTYDPELDIYTPRQEEDPKPGHPVPLSRREAMGWLSKERSVTIPQAIQEMAKAVGERLRGHDDEINAIKEQMAITQKHIDVLQTELRMLKCQLAVAQRQSLAAKLREKGVTK